MDRGAQSAGKRADRATVRNFAGPLGEGNALGRDRQHRSRESLFGNALSSRVGRAVHGGTAQPAQCPSAAGSGASTGGNPECARGPQSGRRSHPQLGRKPLGRAPGRSLRWSSRCAGGNRTATGWLPLVALPRSLSAPAPLPPTGAARGKSFRPTASSPYRKSTSNSLQDCPTQPSMADISIWQKSGHFYFALTALSLPWSTHRSSLESPSAHSVRSAPRTAYSPSGDQFFSCLFWSFIETQRCARRVLHIGQPQVESS